jgi:LDH2 family malate/lactate/ureidoglycolate dehydrogenase
MAYPGLRRPALGNGPLAYAIPTSSSTLLSTDRDFPLVFDAAMTASGGQLIELAERGEALPDYLGALDVDGRPTRDPGAVLEGGATLPIGMHKGAGIVLLTELLTGVLGGGAYLHGDAAGELRIGAPSQCLIALNIEAFMPPADFQARLRASVRELKAAGVAEGSTVYLPGERAYRRYEECLEQGVPLGDGLMANLRGVADDWGAPLEIAGGGQGPRN